MGESILEKSESTGTAVFSLTSQLLGLVVIAEGPPPGGRHKIEPESA